MGILARNDVKESVLAQFAMLVVKSNRTAGESRENQSTEYSLFAMNSIKGDENFYSPHIHRYPSSARVGKRLLSLQ
jgi:hypothetical protein